MAAYLDPRTSVIAGTVATAALTAAMSNICTEYVGRRYSSLAGDNRLVLFAAASASVIYLLANQFWQQITLTVDSTLGVRELARDKERAKIGSLVFRHIALFATSAAVMLGGQKLYGLAAPHLGCTPVTLTKAQTAAFTLFGFASSAVFMYYKRDGWKVSGTT
jgi:hypothetical protein